MSLRPSRLLLWLALLLPLSIQVGAGNIQSAVVTYDQGKYRLSFDVVINANLDTVRAIVTDYANFDQISDMVIESALLETADAEQERRLLIVRACFMFICRNLHLVEDVAPEGDDRFTTTVVPEQSDFKSGSTHWRITGVDREHTRIEFSGYEEPGVWIPPLLGPVLVKRKLLKEARAVIHNIEKLSGND